MIVVYAPNDVLMLTLHAPGGVEVDVAPDQVTSLRNPPTKGDRASTSRRRPTASSGWLTARPFR